MIRQMKCDPYLGIDRNIGNINGPIDMASATANAAAAPSPPL